jgi:hypothetical protein
VHILVLLQVRDLVGRSAKRDHLRQLQRMHYVSNVVPYQLLIIENITQLANHYVAYGAKPGVCVCVGGGGYGCVRWAPGCRL